MGNEMQDALNQIIEEKCKTLREYGNSEGLKDFNDDSFVEKNLEEIKKCYESVFKDFSLTETEEESFKKLSSVIIKSRCPSYYCPGLVFAGFGRQDLFPSLCHILLDGIYDAEIKYDSLDRMDIDRNENKGTVISFAQSDVAERFLYGMDASVEHNIIQFFTRAFSILPDVLQQSGMGKRTANKVKSVQDIFLRTISDQYYQSGRSQIREQVFLDVQSIVVNMPKQELANFAESLVNITTIKRKMSAEQETVGGPIDVAIISKHEGFVWVKRKHYFPADLNPRFFWRKFGSASQPGGASDETEKHK